MQPNILLIVNDSARIDRCSCYGYDRPTTPVLDEIAAEGVRFDRCYSESNWTVPVMFTLLTGLAPREHRGEDLRRLVPDMPTLPELLQGAGYTTYAGSANPFFGGKCQVKRGFDQFYRSTRSVRITKPIVKYIQRFGWVDNGGRAVTDQFLGFLRDAKPPWFALLWYFDAHTPYAPREPFTSRFTRGQMSIHQRAHLMKGLRRPPEMFAGASEAELDQMRDLYDAAMAYEDSLFGEIRQGLRRAGQWDDTLVALTADHGEMLGEGRLGGHGRPVGMHEAVVHVPLVLHGPDVPSGTISNAPVQMADLSQATAALAGIPDALPPTAAPRLNLLDAIDGPGRPHVISERDGFNDRSAKSFVKRNPSVDIDPYLCHMGAVVRDGWKLVECSDGRRELSRIAGHAGEISQPADSRPDEAAALAEILANWRERAMPHTSVHGLAGDDEAIVEKRLQDLGYF